MSIPTNKEELIQSITENYKRLTEELLTIPIEYVDRKELEGHSKNTLMSINNLISYLIGWGELILKWENKKNKNSLIDFPDTGYKWNELGLLAQKFYKDYENISHKKLIDKLNHTVSSILNLIHAKTNKELYEINWYNSWTQGRMIQLNTSSPYKNARMRIRKWKKLNHLK